MSTGRKTNMIYIELFLSFFQVGLFSIGGGMAAIPLIQEQIVNIKQWLTLSEFTDLVTIAEMTPGPIALNAATFVGTQVDGFLGSIVATIGCITPSCIIVSILAYIYHKYSASSVIQDILFCIRPAVVALIAAAGLNFIDLGIWNNSSLGKVVSNINIIYVLLFITAILFLRKFKFNPILVMFIIGILGCVLYLFI